MSEPTDKELAEAYQNAQIKCVEHWLDTGHDLLVYDGGGLRVTLADVIKNQIVERFVAKHGDQGKAFKLEMLEQKGYETLVEEARELGGEEQAEAMRHELNEHFGGSV